MKIIEPSVELWLPKNEIQHVARCARVCYGKESGDDTHLYNALSRKGHFSMYRHETHYIVIPSGKTNVDDCIDTILNLDGSSPGFDWTIGPDEEVIIVLNGQWCIENYETYHRLEEYEITMQEFQDMYVGFPPALNMMRYTFCITTQISTTRELNRVSPNNIAEQSTRYVESDGIVCRPHWITDSMIAAYNDSILREYTFSKKDYVGAMYLDACEKAFKSYKKLISNYISREDARGVLPLDTATKVVYTYSVEEWKHILDLRLYDKTGKAHPNCKVVMKEVEKLLKEKGYGFN